MVARSLAMEALRYLSTARQVADAIRIAGIRAGSVDLAVVVFGDATCKSLEKSQGWVHDDRVLDARGKSLAHFGITNEEAATVPEDHRADLVLERVALLDVMK